MPESVLLTAEDKALLMKVSNLLEEIVETFSIIDDKEAMASIKRAEKSRPSEQVERLQLGSRRYRISEIMKKRKCPETARFGCRS